MVVFDRALQLSNSDLVIFLLKRLPLEHQILGGGQRDAVKAFRHRAGKIGRNLHPLHIFRGAWGAAGFGQPETDRLAAKAFHAGQNAPDLAAHFLAVAPIVGGGPAALDDDPACGLVDPLDVDGCDFFHRLRLLSWYAVLYAVGDKQRQ